MRFLRAPLLGLLMALVLTLTGQAMAVARATAGPAGFAELCIGSGAPLMVAVDENGAPTGPAHICTDFALHGFDIGASTPFLPKPPQTVSRLVLVAQDLVSLARSAPRPQARGPPTFL